METRVSAVTSGASEATGKGTGASAETLPGAARVTGKGAGREAALAQLLAGLNRDLARRLC